MDCYKIKEYKPGHEQEVYCLVKAVYDEFISHENSTDGNQLFYEWISPGEIANRQKSQNNMWLAWMGKELLGMIEIRDSNTVSLLFVNKYYQNNGIARHLFQTALTECTKRGSDIDKFYVHASICSVLVYKNLGFYVTGKAHKENGIYYVPMEMTINKEDKNRTKVKKTES